MVILRQSRRPHQNTEHSGTEFTEKPRASHFTTKDNKTSKCAICCKEVLAPIGNTSNLESHLNINQRLLLLPPTVFKTSKRR